MLEFVRRDGLAAVIPALPIPVVPDLRELPAGRYEDGELSSRLTPRRLTVTGSPGAQTVHNSTIGPPYH